MRRAMFLFTALILFCAIASLRTHAATLSTKGAIRSVFGKYADQALRVVSCETGGTFSLTARNGQYLGLFQMGSWERATYAHGRYTTALEQSRAAWRYFAVTGYDSEPLELQAMKENLGITLHDSAHFTPQGRRLLVSLGVVTPDPLRVEAERWLSGHKGPMTEAVLAVRKHIGVTPQDWLDASERMKATTWKGPLL